MSATARGTKRALRVAAAGWLYRGLAVGAQLLSMPALLGAMGDSGFAVFAVLVSALPWFALADWGLGMTVQNLLARATVPADAGSIVASASVVVMSTIVLGAALVWVVAPIVAPFALARLAVDDMPALAQASRAAGLCFLVTGAGGVVFRALYGIGLGVAANTILAVATLVSLVATVFIVPSVKEGARLLAATVAYAGPVALATVAAGAWLFAAHGRFQLGSVFSGALDLLKKSRGFLLIGFLTACVLNVDYFVMARILPEHEVVSYSFMVRVFSAAITMYGVMLVASAVPWAERLGRKDWQGVLRSWRRHVVLGVAAMLAFAAAVAVSRNALRSFLPVESVARLKLSTILIFGLYASVRALTDASSILLQSAGDTRALVTLIPVQAVLSIFLQIMLGRALGANGIVLGLTLSFVATTAWALPARLRKLSNQRLMRSGS